MPTTQRGHAVFDVTKDNVDCSASSLQREPRNDALFCHGARAACVATSEDVGAQPPQRQAASVPEFQIALFRRFPGAPPRC